VQIVEMGNFVVWYLIRTTGSTLLLISLTSISIFLSLSIYIYIYVRLTFWPYIKLMIVGCLVLPDFDGSLCVYQHLVHPCLSMDLRIIICQFKKLEELFFKKDDFLVEVERYVKENGIDALENLIASTVHILLHGNNTYENLLIYT